MCKSNAQKKFKTEDFPQEFDGLSETPGSQQEKWMACGRILLSSVRILSLNHHVSKILHGNLAHAKLRLGLGAPETARLAQPEASAVLPEPQIRR
jgi:hypothetical protein